MYDFLQQKQIDEIEILPSDSYRWDSGGLIINGLSIFRDTANLRILKAVKSAPDSYLCKKILLLPNGFGSISDTMKYQGLDEYDNSKDIQAGNSFKFNRNDSLKLFVINPTSDYLPANFRHKYNGLYVWDSRDGINKRISKDHNWFPGTVFWLESGSVIIRENKAYNSRGYSKPVKIVNGEIIAVSRIYYD
jgi:hypothetical protein